MSKKITKTKDAPKKRRAKKTEVVKALTPAVLPKSGKVSTFVYKKSPHVVDLRNARQPKARPSLPAAAATPWHKLEHHLEKFEPGLGKNQKADRDSRQPTPSLDMQALRVGSLFS